VATDAETCADNGIRVRLMAAPDANTYAAIIHTDKRMSAPIGGP
jgi:hypothetical protein